MGMKSELAVAVVFAVVAMSGTASAQVYNRPGTQEIVPGGADALPSEKPRTPLEPEERGEELRLSGHCDKAIPIFRRIAARGGYEIADYNLGLCLFDVSTAEADPQRAVALKHEATDAILKAANGGLAIAQIKLVSLYLDGVGVAGDPIEAGKWSLIYHANGARFVIGLKDVPDALQARLDSVLNPTSWAQAQARANAWTPTVKDWDASR
jgi:hypothetical protein